MRSVCVHCNDSDELWSMESRSLNVKQRLEIEPTEGARLGPGPGVASCLLSEVALQTPYAYTGGTAESVHLVFE